MSESEAAASIMEQYEFATPMQTREILVRVNGVFDGDLAGAIIEREVELINPESKNQYCKEVEGHIRRNTYRDLRAFDEDVDIVNVRNGLFSISEGTLKPHSPLYISRIQLPVEFDPNAKCPRILKFLAWALPDPSDRLNILEDAATTLIRDARFQKAFMYVGEGENGKSTWLGVVNALLGKENVTNISIHELGMSRFGAGNIEGKLAIIYPDIAANEIALTGKLKAIISGDRINVEKKGIQGHDIEPYAKLFYSCNSLPEVTDDSRAWFRRWRITDWKEQVDPADKDPELLKKLTTKEELSGLFNVLARIARRLVETDCFSYDRTPEQVRLEWGDRANVIKAFKTAFLVEDSKGAAESGDVFQAYVRFCREHHFTPKGPKGLMDELKKLVPLVRQKERDKVLWFGIRLKEGLDSSREKAAVDDVEDVDGPLTPLGARNGHKYVGRAIKRSSTSTTSSTYPPLQLSQAQPDSSAGPLAEPQPKARLTHVDCSECGKDITGVVGGQYTWKKKRVCEDCWRKHKPKLKADED